MRNFRLDDASLTALAAGHPSAATVGLLRRAQQSRHLLLLSEILKLSGTVSYAPSLDNPMAALHARVTLAALQSGRNPPPAPAPATRHLTATHNGLTLRLRLEDTDPLRTHFGLPVSPPLSEEEAAAWQSHLTAAWQILAANHRPQATTIAAILTALIPLEPAPTSAGISATSADAFGAVALSPTADPHALAVGLLHECQHSLLNAFRTLFDLVTPPLTAGYSPWRDDPRPRFGILHGAYAYQAVTRFWRTEANRTPESGVESGADGGAPASSAGWGERRLAEFEFARWRAAVAAAADGLLASGSLTAAGRRFTEAMRAEVGCWLEEPVDTEVARLAAGANADHLARWRLRNLSVRPGAIEALTAAWRAGAAPPPLPAAALRDHTGRLLERSARLSLIHRTLHERSRVRPGGQSEGAPATVHEPARSGGDPSRGDLAYLTGDLGAAFDAYMKELDETPEGDRETWAGLAISSPYRSLRERPELVRAVFLALEPRDDLHSIARWLDRSCP